MVSPTIVTVIHQYLQEVKKRGVRISQAILFDSYAKGMATSDSDIDLLIIGPDFDPRPSRELVGELWRARAVTDSRIEPIQWAPPVGKKRKVGCSLTSPDEKAFQSPPSKLPQSPSRILRLPFSQPVFFSNQG